QKASDGILITTSDNANTVFDISVIYHVEAENVIKVFNTFGAIPIEVIQAQHIRRAIKDGVNEVGPKYTVFELMGPKRDMASLDLTKELQT
ncbi:hypothetical protein ACI4B7_26975, partial [Klebsiella pneumoniae]|uniref:hypothetical protein n=1 Tax=Klebsiella pneumoniae TaxID=573 RepID=UPI003851C258